MSFIIGGWRKSFTGKGCILDCQEGEPKSGSGCCASFLSLLNFGSVPTYMVGTLPFELFMFFVFWMCHDCSNSLFGGIVSVCKTLVSWNVVLCFAPSECMTMALHAWEEVLTSFLCCMIFCLDFLFTQCKLLDSWHNWSCKQCLELFLLVDGLSMLEESYLMCSMVCGRCWGLLSSIFGW